MEVVIKKIWMNYSSQVPSLMNFSWRKDGYVAAELNELNEAALLQRQEEESVSPEQLKKATLGELLKKPPCIGFVDGSFLAGVKFVEYLQAVGYRFFHIDKNGLKLNAIETLAAPPPEIGPTDRVNVLITTLAEQDVRTLFQRAGADYEAAAQVDESPSLLQSSSVARLRALRSFRRIKCAL